MANGAQFDRDHLVVTYKLAMLYSQDEIDAWLTARHKLLNDARPIDLLGSDRAYEVFAVIDQLESGAYA
jgi:uncharacterized protein (DUF2384 family)